MRYGLPEYDPENYGAVPEPMPTGDADLGIGLAPPPVDDWAAQRAAAFAPAPDLAPDFVRQIPSAAIEEDHRQTQAEEWATNAQGWMADRWADVRGEELRLAAEEIVGNVGEFMTTPIENPLAEVPVVGGLVRRAPAREKPVSEWTEEDYSSLSGILNPPGIAKAPGLVAEGLAAGIGRPARNLPPLPAGFRIRTRADPAADVVVRDAKTPVTNEEISAIREWIAAIGGTQSSTGTRQGIWGYIPGEEAGEVLGGGLGGLARRVAGLAKGGAEEIPPTARPIALTTEEEIARLRLDKFPEEVRGTILEAAQDVDWARTQRRGVIPDEAAQGMADDIVKTVDDWIRGGKAGKAYNQEELIALRNTVGSQANRVDEAVRAMNQGEIPPGITNPVTGADTWFHGTAGKAFAEFDPARAGKGLGAGDWSTLLGSHFTSLEDVARGIAGKAGTVIPASLRMTNPMRYAMESDMADDAVRAALESGVVTPEQIRKASGSAADALARGRPAAEALEGFGADVMRTLPAKAQRAVADTFQSHLKELGHDGIIYANAAEGPMGHASAVIFDTANVLRKGSAQEMADQLLIRTLAETDRLNALVTIAEGGKAEAGRALRAFKQGTRLIDLEPADAIARIVKKFGSRDKALEAIGEYQKMLDNGADVFQQARFWSKLEKGPPGFVDWAKLVSYNSMLSGPRTAEVNTIGTAMEVPWRLARDFGASTLRGRPEEIAPEIAGIGIGLKRGLRPFKDVLHHGVTPEQAALGDVPASISARTTGPASAIATGLELPGRVLRATDELMAAMAYGMGEGREAGKHASAQGLRGKAWANAVADFFEHIEDHPEAMDRARRSGDRMTFRGEMGDIGRWLDKGSQMGGLGGLGFHVVMPFLRTLYHIGARGAERTPGVGPAMTVYELAKGTYGKGKVLPEGVSPLGERVGNNVMGTVGGLWLINKALEGNISAAGPENNERRAALEAQGWQRNSIKVGDEWVSYANWGPFAVPLALAASVGEAGLYAKPDDDVKAKAIDAAVRFSKLTQEQTFLAGVGSISKAIEDPERYGANLLTTQMQRLIPYGSTLSTVAQAMETEGARQPLPGDVGGRLAVRIPGLRETQPLREDILGQPMQDPYAGRLELPGVGETIPNAFLPVRRSEIEPDPILTEMERLSAAGFPTSIGRLPADIDGAKLEPVEQKRLQQIYGSKVQARISRIIGRTGYQRASPGVQSEILEEAEHELREDARAQLVKELPELRARIRDAGRAAEDRMRAR